MVQQLAGLGIDFCPPGKPKLATSLALTDIQSKYANIERELLAVVYGCKRIQIYFYREGNNYYRCSFLDYNPRLHDLSKILMRKYMIEPVFC